MFQGVDHDFDFFLVENLPLLCLSKGVNSRHFFINLKKLKLMYQKEKEVLETAPYENLDKQIQIMSAKL